MQPLRRPTFPILLEVLTSGPVPQTVEPRRGWHNGVLRGIDRNSFYAAPLGLMYCWSSVPRVRFAHRYDMPSTSWTKSRRWRERELANSAPFLGAFLKPPALQVVTDYQPNQGRGFAGGFPGTNVRDIRDALKVSLDEILGDIELREFPERDRSYSPPPDTIQARYVPGIFDEIAKKHGLRRASFGRYEDENSYWGLKFWFRDDVTAGYANGGFVDRKILNDIEEALNARFSGLQFYQFDRDRFFVDFQKASLIPAAE